jgi:ectoine hydroxylase-related dioxygenase (phytanoyl-CoA dioxygenase family)
MSRLSPRQIEAFREDGYFNAGRVFDDRELEELRAEYDRILARPMKVGEPDTTPFDYSPALHVQSEVMRRFACARPLVEIAIDLLGPDVRLWWDQAVFKRPGATSEVPWHQDNGYTPIDPPEYVTCTVGIDAHTEANGCLWILPGSHRHGIQPHHRRDGVFYRGYDGDETGVPVTMKAGEVLVFSSLTMHRTGPNRSHDPRRSWVVQYCRGDSVHRETKAPYDDRLLLAEGGLVLDEPRRDRELDFAAMVSDALGDRG